MSNNNFLNVYKGANSVRDFFDPDSAPPLPLVEIPDQLNPYRRDGVRIYAKMMTMHPANNVKAMPALNLLEKSVVPGKTKTIIEYSSGSTVISMSLVSRVFHGVSDVRAFLSNKTSVAKLRLMQFFDLDITLFGGPSQPEPTDGRGGIRAAERMAEDDESIINPNQYGNDDNWKAHVRWTGPQILRQLPEINLICAGMGTSGTMTGLGMYFKESKSSVFRLGVCTAPGDRVPGPRSFALLAPVEFPWKSAVDHIEEVGSHDSFSLSLDMCRQGIVCGPSSGFNLKGLFQFIEKQKVSGTLSKYAGEDGEIHCVFLCCDLPYQYINEYFDKLGSEYFPPIKNEALAKVDLYRYDEAWEKDATTVLPQFLEMKRVATKEEVLSGILHEATNENGLSEAVTLKDDAVIVDIRQPAAFGEFSLPGSVNLPFVDSLTASPFSDPAVLEALWLKIDEYFRTPHSETVSLLQDKRILILCYDGDSSRVATSVLRAKGYEADSVRGGFQELVKLQIRETKGHHIVANGQRPKQGVSLTREVELVTPS
ncbi:tryptophan synthase beta subunit-like PLP-dependent enzyme [Daldinia vernicosa]|uniref:tryptophan synthase beta subunit-like PLP-dependent enzyme n=1 Tax=Daldinia vernicosa TaxID=114800 RepID=UPI002007266E|nr:tryptophan synthase beta subunit-like PLP-dependent enzyme [Daldinia vernicosa]KAI0847204.1 tryptophan synthase beta subunit-like PLP-dependent enzyme [Daldinia vernicosa]